MQQKRQNEKWMEDVCALRAFQDRSIAISFFIDKKKVEKKHFTFLPIVNSFIFSHQHDFVSFHFPSVFHSVSSVRAVAHVEFASVSCSIAIRYNTKCWCSFTYLHLVFPYKRTNNTTQSDGFIHSYDSLHSRYFDFHIGRARLSRSMGIACLPPTPFIALNKLIHFPFFFFSVFHFIFSKSILMFVVLPIGKSISITFWEHTITHTHTSESFEIQKKKSKKYPQNEDDWHSDCCQPTIRIFH